MASSSGCAISSRMRLFCNVGKDAPRVLVYIQKTKMRTGTDAHTVQFMVSKRIQEGCSIWCLLLYCCYVPASGEVARAHEAIEVLERALTHVIFEIP